MELENARKKRYSINIHRTSANNIRRNSHKKSIKLSQELPEESFERRYFLFSSVKKNKNANNSISHNQNKTDFSFYEKKEKLKDIGSYSIKSGTKYIS